jgi:hypothetical protein
MTNLGNEATASWNMGNLKEPGPNLSDATHAWLRWTKIIIKRDRTEPFVNDFNVHQTSAVDFVPTRTESRITHFKKQQ